MSTFLVWTALGFYGLAIASSLPSVIRRRERLTSTTLAAVGAGLSSHLVALVLATASRNRLPFADVGSATSLLAFLVGIAFLASYVKYRIMTLGIFILPLIFVLTLGSLLQGEVDFESAPFRTRWLIVHTSSLFVGYAALFVTFVASLMYLIQEKELKSRKPRAFYYRLPSLEILDDLAFKTLILGLPFVTLGIISWLSLGCSNLGGSMGARPENRSLGRDLVRLHGYLFRASRREVARAQGGDPGPGRFCSPDLHLPGRHLREQRPRLLPHPGKAAWNIGEARGSDNPMNLVLLGLNHRTAPVEVREQFHIPETELGRAVRLLSRHPGVLECMILSTCNRVEFFAHTQDGAEPGGHLREFVADYYQREFSGIDSYFYCHKQVESIRHMFRVASSLDSMVLGEPQILGQVKQAFQTAQDAGALNGLLRDVMNQTLAVARKVRRETAIGSSAVSISSAAVELARKIFGDLRKRTIFIIGAGKMSELAAKNLLRSGASTILVSNRTYERAVEMAQLFQGTAIRFEELLENIPRADIVISLRPARRTSSFESLRWSGCSQPARTGPSF